MDWDKMSLEEKLNNLNQRLKILEISNTPTPKDDKKKKK